MDARYFLPILVSAGLLAGCGRSHSHQARSSSDYELGDGAIDLRDDEVVIRAGGQIRDAHVGADGELKIGSRVIETSVEGRAALKQYEAGAVAVKEHAIALGVAGAQFGLDTVKDVVKGLLDGTADEAGKRADESAGEFEAQAYRICDRVAELRTAQDVAAVAVPEFRPYAVISEKQVR